MKYSTWTDGVKCLALPPLLVPFPLLFVTCLTIDAKIVLAVEFIAFPKESTPSSSLTYAAMATISREILKFYFKIMLILFRLSDGLLFLSIGRQIFYFKRNLKKVPEEDFLFPLLPRRRSHLINIGSGAAQSSVSSYLLEIGITSAVRILSHTMNWLL